MSGPMNPRALSRRELLTALAVSAALPAAGLAAGAKAPLPVDTP